jgi:acyl-coenzyme A thioesterase PaaI-like protein
VEAIDQRIDKGQANQTLKVTFPLSAMPKQAQDAFTTPGLSTYLAMMDDVTTWALVLADAKRGRAGKSVSFHAAWNPDYDALSLPHHPIYSDDDSVIELSASVKKIGQNIGFVAAQVRNVTDTAAARNDIICYGSQIKYLPMGTVADFALSSLGWEWTKLYSNHILSRKDTITSQPASDIYHSFQVIHGDDADPAVVAKFTPSKEHISLGGPIHGGCQAVLMEMAAKAYFKTGALTATAREMQVDYMSPPKSKTIFLKVFPVVDAPSSLTSNRQSLCVQLLSSDQRKVQSQGLLHFVVAS